MRMLAEWDVTQSRFRAHAMSQRLSPFTVEDAAATWHNCRIGGVATTDLTWTRLIPWTVRFRVFALVLSIAGRTQVPTMSEAAEEVPFDPAKADAFAHRLLQNLNHGAWCLMASIGHRTGLFDAMRDLPASTVQDIARAARLNDRYVREWLGAMVAAGVIDVDATSTFYSLPPEHAAMLTRAAGPDNIAALPSSSPCSGTLKTTS